MELFTTKEKAKAYDKIKLLVKNGQKESIRKYAESKGLCLNSYIKKLIKEDMNKSQSYNYEEEQKELSETEIPVKELELTMVASYRINNMGVKNIDDFERIIKALGEEKIKRTLMLNQEEYNELIQQIKDFK